MSALTSLRFFAALEVSLYHLVRPFSLWGPLEPVVSVGYVGVSFFFVLSGFILTYSHAVELEQGRGDAVRFWVARFARIYPIYLLSMVAVAYTNREQFHPLFRGMAYVADLLLIQSWSSRMVNFFHITGWTLSVEAFFYLVFPFVLLRMRPVRFRTALSALAACWLLAMAAPLLCLYFYPEAAFGAVAPGGLLVFRVTRLPLLALPEFLAGIAAGWLFLRFPPRARWSAWVAGAGAVLLAAALIFSHSLPFVMLHNGLLIPAYVMVIVGVSQPNWISRLLSASFFVLLGEASYALYLIHFMFGGWTVSLGASTTILAACWKLALLIPISIALHVFVERPCRRSILRWWSRRHPVPSAAILESSTR